MKMLHEDLHALAEQAPAVDLAARAVRGARRRRASRLAVVAAVVVCAITGGGALVLQQGRPEPPIVLTPPKTEDVPDKSVWHVATPDGARELAGVPENGPVEVTVDGRRVAYYSPELHRIVLRDLVTGKVRKAPLKQQGKDFADEFALRLSPSGTRFIVSGWGGRKEPNKLVDLERGTVTDLRRGWWPVSVADGNGPVVLAKAHGESAQVWVLGHEPITIPDFTYQFSALGPDGSTLVRVGTSFDRKRQPMVQTDGTIVAFDAVTGRGERRIRLIGVDGTLRPAKLGGWLNGGEVTLLAVSPEPGNPSVVYAVDVATGQARKLFEVPDQMRIVVPGLVR